MLAPVLVTPEPPRTAKGFAVPRFTVLTVAAIALSPASRKITRNLIIPSIFSATTYAA
jgi:hypothetical protein